ncbi:glucose PTS transporter subunit IIA [Microbacterium sp.]|uniref:glucose PTS transporter subunit IIA n=1 Tax=Microbacterium sp. TaxID=51671 RepID=UPI003C75D498
MSSSTTRGIPARILEEVGGPGNVESLTHCATRLRFVLHDPSKADLQTLSNLPGILRAQNAGGQTQVVVGGKVEQYHADIQQMLGGRAATRSASPARKKENVFSRVIAFIASLFTPLLPALVGAGMIKALVTILQTTGVLDPATPLYTVLSIMGDGVFYFLPVFLAITTAKRVDTNPYLAMVLAVAVLHPTWTALVTAGQADGRTTETVLGIPVLLMSYSSTVIPIVLGVIVLKWVVVFFTRIIPEAIRVVFVPTLSLLVVIPLLLVVVGPAGNYLGQGIATGIGWLFANVGWFAQTVLSGLRPVLVIFGLHTTFVPISIQEIAANGATALLVGAFVANLAQAGAAVGLSVLLRDKERSGAAAAGFTAFFGITEPAIYGYNLRYKFPFFLSCVAAALAGTVFGILQVKATAFVLPNLLGVGVLEGNTNLVVIVLVLVGAAVVSAVLTIAYGLTIGRVGLRAKLTEALASDVDDVAEDTSREDVEAAHTGRTAVMSPMNGVVLPLSAVPDKLFAEGVLGNGVAIDPSDGAVVSPVDGTVVTVTTTKHAVGLRTTTGVELLLHVGIDTVKLNGRGFTVKVTPGQDVKVGDELLTVDLQTVREAGYSTITPVVIVDPADTVITAVASDTVLTGQSLFTTGETR